jgi:hypothetical protein
MLGMGERNRDPGGRFAPGRRDVRRDQVPDLPPPRLLPTPDELLAADTRRAIDVEQSGREGVSVKFLEPEDLSGDRAADAGRGEADDAQRERANNDDGRDGGGGGAQLGQDYGLLIIRMDRVEEALQDLELDLKNVADHADRDAQMTMQRELMFELDRLRDCVDRLAAGGRGQGPSAAVAASTQAEAVRADAETAHSRWGAAWSRVWESVKRMLPRLWVLISQLLHVSEWTVGGQLKSDPFGLASASVTVTFARPD